MNQVTITERVLIVVLNRLYKPDVSPEKLYEIAHQAWPVNGQRVLNVDYVIATYKSHIKEVYEVEKWFKVDIEGKQKPRYGFDGKLAPKEIRDKYLNQSAIKYKGNGNSIRYVNC